MKPRNKALNDVLKGCKGGPMEDKKRKAELKAASKQVRDFIRGLRKTNGMLDT